MCTKRRKPFTSSSEPRAGSSCSNISARRSLLRFMRRKFSSDRTESMESVPTQRRSRAWKPSRSTKTSQSDIPRSEASAHSDVLSFRLMRSSNSWMSPSNSPAFSSPDPSASMLEIKPCISICSSRFVGPRPKPEIRPKISIMVRLPLPSRSTSSNIALRFPASSIRRICRIRRSTARKSLKLTETPSGKPQTARHCSAVPFAGRRPYSMSKLFKPRASRVPFVGAHGLQAQARTNMSCIGMSSSLRSSTSLDLSRSCARMSSLRSRTTRWHCSCAVATRTSKPSKLTSRVSGSSASRSTAWKAACICSKPSLSKLPAQRRFKMAKHSSSHKYPDESASKESKCCCRAARLSSRSRSLTRGTASKAKPMRSTSPRLATSLQMTSISRRSVEDLGTKPKELHAMTSCPQSRELESSPAALWKAVERACRSSAGRSSKALSLSSWARRSCSSLSLRLRESASCRRRCALSDLSIKRLRMA
mmetsp:Transcript_51503/g.131027  ORF Transcript_51503/g.131027 Transcript_51503/m.131027 type:complete len:478 (+) Transcript_51503:102-1535(+)